MNFENLSHKCVNKWIEIKILRPHYRRNRVLAILCPEVSFTDSPYRVVSPNIIRSMAFHKHSVFLLGSPLITRNFFPFPVNQYRLSYTVGRVIAFLTGVILYQILFFIVLRSTYLSTWLCYRKEIHEFVLWLKQRNQTTNKSCMKPHDKWRTHNTELFYGVGMGEHTALVPLVRGKR